MDTHSHGNPSPSCDYSKFHYELEVITNILFEDDFGDVGEDQLSYPSSPAATLPPFEISTHEDPLLAELLFECGGSLSTNANINNVINDEHHQPQGDVQKPRKVAFKTKTNLDVLDDGYRWRKYGKKAVKNSPNLRNYYKCTGEGCQVKKIVERWDEDSSYLISQYEGVHTHESPSAHYYNNNSHHHHFQNT